MYIVLRFMIKLQTIFQYSIDLTAINGSEWCLIAHVLQITSLRLLVLLTSEFHHRVHRGLHLAVSVLGGRVLTLWYTTNFDLFGRALHAIL